MKIHILYTHYFDRNGKELSVGGIQTYITSLSNLLVSNGYEVSIYQSADVSFKKKINGIIIYGCKCSIKDAKNVLVKECNKYLSTDDLIIFGTDSLAMAVNAPSIAIQHGVSWDVPQKSVFYFLNYLKKSYKAWKRINQINCVDQIICVDNNFSNWIRAIAPYCKVNLKTIPNFTRIPTIRPIKENNKSVKIIFARRFFWYRGTVVFAHAIERILNERDNIFVTFAGEGDDEKFLRDKFSDNPHVSFIKYESDKSLSIHEDKHIAVVPTVGSEGTSLSLLEAMASGCAVIGTDVGGITDIIINGYNGLMVSSGNADELYDAIIRMIDDREYMEKISLNGYEVVKNSFSYDNWANEWLNVISKMKNTNKFNKKIR